MTQTIERAMTIAKEPLTPEEQANTLAMEVCTLAGELTVGEIAKDFYGTGINPQLIVSVHGANYGHELFIKDETEHFVDKRDDQGKVEKIPVETYKRRGALANALISLSKNPEIQRLYANSSGNHAQGVAAAALDLHRSARIFMENGASKTKVDRTRKLGARVNTNFTSLDEAGQTVRARADSDKQGLYISPYNQVETIAGQATIGLEILNNLSVMADHGETNLNEEPIIIMVPVGGGGLIAGIASVIKEAKDKGKIGDNVKVVGVQAENKESNSFVDGTKTKTGELPSLILDIPGYVDRVITVSDLEVAKAMTELSDKLGKPIEPAGALAHAGAKKLSHDCPIHHGYKETKFISVITGASTSPETLSLARQIIDASEDSPITYNASAGIMAGCLAVSGDNNPYRRAYRKSREDYLKSQKAH